MSWNILEHPTQSKSGMTVRCFVFDSWHKLQTYPYHWGPRVWENIYRFSRATPLARMAYDAPIGMHCLEHAVVEHSCIVCSTNLLSILVAHQHIVICQVKFQYPGLDVVAGNVVTPKQVGTERMLWTWRWTLPALSHEHGRGSLIDVRWDILMTSYFQLFIHMLHHVTYSFKTC